MPGRSTKRGKLAEYRRKRDFARTSEPSGAAGGGAGKQPALRFVVQKHAATRLHFDLRLELDGVMKSWAVPKGPSLDPAVKRLAMEVEDHPIEYNAFEGTIPKGEYGGGTVMLWDRGTYEPTPGSETFDLSSLRDGFRAGKVDVSFHGERLHGSFALVRMRGSDEKPQWLLIKHRDRFADPTRDIVAEEVTSVATGRTMEEIARGAPERTKGRRKQTAPKRGGPKSAARKAAAKQTARKKPGRGGG